MNGKGSKRRPENNERMKRNMDIYHENCRRERNGEKIMTRDEVEEFLERRINHAGTLAFGDDDKAPLLQPVRPDFGGVK